MRRIRREGGRIGAILALLLLLFLLLVIAYVLYTMQTGYLGATGAKPNTISFTSTGFFRNAHITDINFTVVATSSQLTAGELDFTLLSANRTTLVPLGIASSNDQAGCTAGNPFQGCGAGNGTPGTWYLVVTDSAANVEAVFDASGWVVGANEPVTVSDTLSVVSAANFIGSDDVLQANGTTASAPSGSTTL